MEILNQGRIDFDKRTVFLDVDDVLLESSQTVVDILNERRISKGLGPLPYEKHHDWKFKSFDRTLTSTELEEIFDSDKFFSMVKFSPLLETFESSIDDENGLFNSYNWILVTKGNQLNLEKKFELIFSTPFFKEHKDSVGYYGLTLNEDKSMVHMVSGIQIDDNYHNLKDTDADLKILVKNDCDTDYNMMAKTTKDNLQNLYITDNIEQVVEILSFIHKMDLEGIDVLEDMELFLADE